MDYDEYDDDLLVAIYDGDNPDGPDHNHYRELAARLNAAHITDLGCGTGILTVTLAAPGRTVIGIDPAAAMLARASSRPAGDSVEWRLGTSRLIDTDRNDLITMTGNVAMHILGDDWHTTLKDIARGLRPGGLLAFETRNPAAQAWTGWNDPGSERNTAAGLLRETTTTSEPDPDGVIIMRCHNEFKDADRKVDVEQRLQFRTVDQITADLDRAGLTVLRISSDWTGTPFAGVASERLMIFEASPRPRPARTSPPSTTADELVPRTDISTDVVDPCMGLADGRWSGLVADRYRTGIVVVAPSPHWAEQYGAVAADLAAALAHVPVEAIEHVGSTSVPSLPAKPILDIDVIVQRDNLRPAIQALEQTGYRHCGDLGVADREVFEAPDESPSRNVYLCVTNTLHVRNHLAVRDALRARPDLRDRHGAVKLQLAGEPDMDITRYLAGKSMILQEILALSNLTAEEKQTIFELNTRTSS